MGLIKYDISINPTVPTVNLGIGVTPRSLSITANSLGSYSVSVAPTTGTIVAGAIAGSILSVFGGALTVGAIYAVADKLKAKIDDAIKSELPGTSTTYELDHPLGYTIQVMGVDVKVEAETVTLSTYQGMLMAQGSVKVS